MSTTTITTLKITAATLLKLALVAALLGGFASAMPANLTHINPTAAVQLSSASAEV
jgi:hypothetical protein